MGPTRNPLVPTFDAAMANVTVKEGQVAVLPCEIKFLGTHSVSWADKGNTVLTLEDRRIIDDDRMSVERPSTKAWNLHIREVTHQDEGLYSCMVNTSPVKIKQVTLKVKVPAKILNVSTESATVREGATVTLQCHTSGIPEPTVDWRRLTASEEKGEEIQSEFCPGTTTVGRESDVLIIHNISRECGDIYECVANNYIDAPVSRLIPVRVQFPPEVEMPTKRLGQDIGKETILECKITANPQVRGIWTKNGKEIKNLVWS
ncbi:opioid-binding protein/cell adhesion molecule [Plakobranchus ocellatus]|uniref:Opioid-binding protein/cell adhesion molecule n=1 Tax=Plakobranchus ocellatus TaxID=259542 RepID=A0AAV4C3E2_9GAST|nr:opioid-binding protein/cell adhesion molecule [Plakobranchus ocellatus]